MDIDIEEIKQKLRDAKDGEDCMPIGWWIATCEELLEELLHEKQTEAE